MYEFRKSIEAEAWRQNPNGRYHMGDYRSGGNLLRGLVVESLRRWLPFAVVALWIWLALWGGVKLQKSQTLNRALEQRLQSLDKLDSERLRMATELIKGKH